MRLCLLCAILAVACDDAALPAAPVVKANVAPQPAELPLHTTDEPVLFVDLLRDAARAHVRRGGPVMVPGGPGWDRVTRLGERTAFKRPRPVRDMPAAWLESIGGTLYFPVGPEGADMQRFQVWLQPVSRGQRVSVFVDEQPITTLRLEEKGRLYTFNLPGPLAEGEHTIRFWFRFRRTRGKGRRWEYRTPGAVGPVRLIGGAEPTAMPTAWVADMAVAGISGPALLAGPPAGWRYFLMPPVGARFQARAAVAAGEAVEFIVRVTGDGAPIKELVRIKVDKGEVAEIDVDLGPYADQPIRLSLDTEGGSGELERAGWLEPRIMRPAPPRTTAPPVRNVIIWAVDGMRSDRVGLGRGGDRAATPNLDLLALEGAGAVELWSGGGEPEAGHRRLLRPVPALPALPTLMMAEGRRPGLISASAAVDPELAEAFNTRMDLRRAGEPADSRTIIRELDDWLDVRKKDPFFLYLAAEDPRVPLEPPPGYERQYRRARPIGLAGNRNAAKRKRDLFAAYDAELSAADYWIGQLVATLATHDVLDDTAIIVVGTVGQDLGEAGGIGDGHTLSPELLRVPMVLWHPRLRRSGEPRPLVRGGDMIDVAATALALVGGRAPPAWTGLDLTTALFGGLPLAPLPSHANAGRQAAARYGAWLMRGAGPRDLQLWNVVDDPAGRDEIGAAHPIALRTLRDSMQDRP